MLCESVVVDGGEALEGLFSKLVSYDRRHYVIAKLGPTFSKHGMLKSKYGDTQALTP